MPFTDAADYTGSHEEEEHHMGRQVSFRLRTLTARRAWTALCIGVALFSLWLSAGCQPTAQRTPPTPPAVETPEPEPDSSPAVKPLPASAPTALSETELPATGPYAGITETGEPPPDEYYGDPLYWIPGMAYETFHNPSYGNSSAPVWPPSEEIGRRIAAREEELFKAYDGEIEDSHVKSRVFRLAEREVISESMSPLHAAKYLGALGSSLYTDKARELAQVALDANPDDFHTLLLWTALQYEPDDEASRKRAVAGYRRLLEMNPNSARVTHDLGRILYRADEFEESVHLLKKAAQLDTRYQESAFLRLAMSYYGVGDKEQALAYLKRLAEVASTQRARETTRERIEALEQQGEWLLFVD